MTIAEQKLELIRKIIATDDISILTEIKEVFLNKEETFLKVNEPLTTYQKEEKVYVFNEWQQKRIDKALEQVKNGEVVTNEEAEKEIQKWFLEQEKLFGQ